MKRILVTASICLSVISCGNCSKDNDDIRMLVGTYTKNNDSQGVYLYEFNQDNASFAFLDTAKVGNPSFIIPSADRRFAYGVSEFNDGSEGACTFKLDDTSIDLIGIRSTNPEAFNNDGSQTPGGAPCNITIVGNTVVTSNYMGGTISSFPINQDGSLAPMSELFVPDNDEGIVSHMHCAKLSPDGKYLFANDLGADITYRFNVDGNGVDFSNPQKACCYDRSSHPGPRHIIFNDAGDRAYLISEPGDNLTVFKYGEGALEIISDQLAYDGEGHGSADIHLSPDGRFLYTSHRLKKDGIAVFKISRSTGDAEPAGFFPTGKHPRNFAITPNGKFLLCACRDTNSIDIYAINRKDGSLSETGISINIPAPVCIQLF